MGAKTLCIPFEWPSETLREVSNGTVPAAGGSDPAQNGLPAPGHRCIGECGADAKRFTLFGRSY